MDLTELLWNASISMYAWRWISNPNQQHSSNIMAETAISIQYPQSTKDAIFLQGDSGSIL